MAKKITPVFDTSVFSDYIDEIDKNILFVLFPTVVLFELVATSIDAETLQRYERWRVLLNADGRLLNPTARDWWETSKAVRRLYMNKNAQLNKLRTIRNDALIARLAVIHGGYVVTHNMDDFSLILKVMPDLRLLSANDFFGS